jgi:HD-GYP domain-containing protein (c-di-GMP phosphodiesterase class II)
MDAHCDLDSPSSARAYRAAMPLEKVFEIMGQDVPHVLDVICFEALKAVALSLGAFGER